MVCTGFLWLPLKNTREDILLEGGLPTPLHTGTGTKTPTWSTLAASGTVEPLRLAQERGFYTPPSDSIGR